MALQTTQWRPDTCGCVLSYSWDDAAPEDQRTHTPGPSQPCAAHAGNPAGAYAAVVDENQMKNRMMGHLAQAEPTLAEAVRWSFDADRRLRLDMSGVKTAERARMQALVAAHPDAKRVRVV